MYYDIRTFRILSFVLDVVNFFFFGNWITYEYYYYFCLMYPIIWTFLISNMNENIDEQKFVYCDIFFSGYFDFMKNMFIKLWDYEKIEIIVYLNYDG